PAISKCLCRSRWFLPITLHNCWPLNTNLTTLLTRLLYIVIAHNADFNSRPRVSTGSESLGFHTFCHVFKGPQIGSRHRRFTLSIKLDKHVSYPPECFLQILAVHW